MLTKNILFKNFLKEKTNKKISKILNSIISNNMEIIQSLKKSYISKYKIKKITKIVGKRNIRIIGVGGSILGAKAIYDFLEKKIKKRIYFVDNLVENKKKTQAKFSKTNLIISKSGDTLETIINSNISIDKKDKNIFIIDNKNSYLKKLALKLKSEIVEHNNYIGGRYAVLSEVGMLPAELMGLNPKNFRQLDELIKNKKFLGSLISNVNSILFYVKNNRYNSIIINYDENLLSFHAWYQQLVAESLGKKSKGILPMISSMPKDNHSVMQLYLDGFKKNFYSIFFSKEIKSNKLNNANLLKELNYLKGYNINEILFFQKKATEKIFKNKKIPFRSFELIHKSEKTMGELFCFFILETILLGRMLDVNPFDQPSVDLLKKETKKFF
jgi:glucose-6-phosphate isomerase